MFTFGESIKMRKIYHSNEGCNGTTDCVASYTPGINIFIAIKQTRM